MSQGARAYAVLGLITAGIALAVGLTSDGWVGPVRQFHSIYILHYEEQTFSEGGLSQSFPPKIDADNVGYLSAKDITLPSDPCQGAGEPSVAARTEVFEIRFIGRRKPGPAGHIGGYRARYLVEQVIDIRSVAHLC